MGTTKRLTLCLTTIFLLMNLLVANVNAKKLVAGKDYWRLPVVSETTKEAEKAANYYFSWLGCDSCLMIEQQVDLAGFERLPLIARPNWRAAAKIFYAMELLALSDEQKAQFIQKLADKKLDPIDFQAMSEAILEFGVEPELLDKTLTSKALFDKVNRAQALARQYQIKYAPTVVVDGKFATDARHAKTIARFQEIIKTLQK